MGSSGQAKGLARPVIYSPTLVFCSGASRAVIGRPGTLCVGAVGRSAAICNVYGGRGDVSRGKLQGLNPCV